MHTRGTRASRSNAVWNVIIVVVYAAGVLHVFVYRPSRRASRVTWFIVDNETGKRIKKKTLTAQRPSKRFMIFFIFYINAYAGKYNVYVFMRRRTVGRARWKWRVESIAIGRVNLYIVVVYVQNDGRLGVDG